MPRLDTIQTAIGMVLVLALMCPTHVTALESDRQQQLHVNADYTDGTLRDGKMILKGNVEIRQGTLLIRADVAEIEKVEGKVREVILTGNPVHLEQEIENEGLVKADAQRVEYQVSSGMVTLTGSADVVHPQYRISGEVLKYDLNVQHFQGIGGEKNGRIKIRMEPEVVPDLPRSGSEGKQDAQSE